MKTMKSSLALLALLAVAGVRADVPVSINYTGHLAGVADGAEAQLSDKVILMAFRLYDEPGSGLAVEKKTALWGRMASVSLSNGDFDIDLTDTFGSQLADTKYVSLADAIAAAQEAGSSDLYLGLTPANDSNAEIYPRQKLTAVPKAVLARAVRNLPADFVSTSGTVTVQGPLTVKGTADVQGDASYGQADFPVNGQLNFKGGVAVRGTLHAESVTAAGVEAEQVTAGVAQTVGQGTLTVSGPFVAAGTTTWNGDLRGAATTVTTPAVAGTVEADEVRVTKLKANSFVNNSDDPIYQKNVDWKLIRKIVTIEEEKLGYPGVDRYDMNIYDTKNKVIDKRKSIVWNIWSAPCDCLAYFQTFLRNYGESADFSTLQFFIVETPQFTDFASTTPNAVAHLGEAQGTLKTVVPLLLRKGQIVKWIGYNKNKAGDSKIQETADSRVTAIRYLPFGWDQE